jgi:HK97 gp10 family phage protein
MSRNMPVKGVKELDFYLSSLPEQLQNNAYRAGLTAAAAVVRKEARVRARKRSGKMAKAIKSGSPRRNQDGSYSIAVRLVGEHAFLGLFHEYGVDPHLITVQEDEKPTKLKKDGRKQVLPMKAINNQVRSGSLVIGTNFVGPVVSHPGHSAHPFLRPALDEKAEEAVQAFASRIRLWFGDKTGAPLPLEPEE